MSGDAMPAWIPGSRLEEAVVYAIRAHARQARKGGTVPYLAHLFGVASLVMEDGGTEDETIAALLHDAAEDQGGEERLRDIEVRFGPDVAAIVRGCSEPLATPRPAWGERKSAYVDHLTTASESVLRVALADKVHNARAMARDYATVGESLWGRFNAGRSEQAKYFRSLCKALQRLNSPAWHELNEVVDRIFPWSDEQSETPQAATAFEPQLTRDGECRGLEIAFRGVFNPRAPGYFQKVKGNYPGIHDGARGVQWNCYHDHVQSRVTLGVNLEGMEFDGWPIGRLIDRELMEPTLPSVVAELGAGSHSDLVVSVWRDTWQNEHHITRSDETLEFAMRELTRERWGEMLRRARSWLAGDGRARRQLPPPSSGRSTSPHLQFATTVWLAMPPSHDERLQQMKAARSRLEVVHRWALERSRAQ